MTQIGFPFRIAADGRTAQASEDEHIRQLIGLVLFTNQGERFNRMDFGSGVKQLVFSENAPELATALQHIAHSSLQRWLSDLIEVRDVSVQADEARLSVLVRFRSLKTDEERMVRLVRQA
jgi:uncharacterized protein